MRRTAPWLRAIASGDKAAHRRAAAGRRGPGVDDADKDTIFELFHHSRKTGVETGIGLALVRELVDAHDGRCWVDDRPGGGASFRIWLPATPAPS